MRVSMAIVVSQPMEYKMEVSPVRQFVCKNILEFELIKKQGKTKLFHFYDKNSSYFGQYCFNPLTCSDYLGVAKSVSTTQILNKRSKPVMQENIFMEKEFVEVLNPSKESGVKAIPQKITKIITFFDYVNDKFVTVMKEIVLKNKLNKVENTKHTCNNRFIIYEALKEKPVYGHTSKVLKQGFISDTEKASERGESIHRNILGYPYIIW